MNLETYMAWRSKEMAWAIIAIAIRVSTKIIVFLYPIMLTIFVETTDPTFLKKYQQ